MVKKTKVGKDISNRAVLIVLVVVLVLSVVSLMMFSAALEKSTMNVVSGARGHVNVKIVDPVEQKVSEPAVAGGKVQMEILPPPAEEKTTTVANTSTNATN